MIKGEAMTNAKKAVILITIGTLLSNLLGFSRELILAYKYGAGSIADMYLIASIIPGTIFVAIASAIATSYIPIVTNLGLENTKKINLFTSNLLNILGILTLGILIVFLIITKPIVKLFAIGFSGDMLSETVLLTRLMLPLILSLVFYNIFQGYLHVKDKFFAASLIGIPLNIFFITGIIFSSPEKVWIMAIGNLAGYVAVFLFLLIVVLKSGFTHTFTFNFKDSNLRKILLLSIPIFIGISVTQVNTIVDRSLASTLEGGVISALNYSSRLIYFINGIFVISLVTVIFPRLAKLNFSKDLKEFKSVLNSSMITIIILVFPISVGAIILSEPIIRLLFERGAFDSEATNYTSSALIFYSIGIIGIGLRELLTTVFYSIEDTKSPMINGSIAVVLNIILNLIFIKYMGYIGLPLATSVASIVSVLLLGKTLRKKIGAFGIRNIIVNTSKIGISSLLMGILVFITYKNLMKLPADYSVIAELLSLLASILLGICLYFWLLKLMKIKEVTDLIAIFKGKLKVVK